MLSQNHQKDFQEGQLYFQSGRQQEAYKIARQLLSLYPKDISLLLFTSKVTLSLQLFEDSIAHAIKATEIAPDRADIHLCLAECYAISSQWIKSEMTLDKVAALENIDFQILDSIASLYSLCNRYEKALKTISYALELKPNNAKLIYNMAIQQRFLGKIEDAEKSLNQVIELDPNNTEAIYILSGLRRQTKELNHIPHITAERNRLKNNHQAVIQLNYALAKEYEDLGEWEKSFEALSHGAKAKRETFKYNSAQNIKILQRTAILQSKAYLSTLVKSCHKEGPIFILGLPRTGSTLVDTIISSHKDVVSAGELPDFPKYFIAQINKLHENNKIYNQDKMALSLNIDFQELGENYIKSVTGKIGSHRYFTDKLPFNFQYCGMIKRALPKAKIIHVKRDPMDSCYSIFKALFLSPYPYSYNLEELAQYFIAYYRLMDHWREAMEGDILDVNYEDVIRDHEAETRRIIDWCGLEWDPACLDYRNTHKAITTLSAPQVRKDIYSSSIGKWRHFEQQMEPVRNALEKAKIIFK
ncbi:MAG: sulfotransferase [Emcibacter sp.]|nr:sulfotransferase [Emcibacter sp.]